MHSKMFRKILAGILVFTLTFANPALITKSFATSIFETVANSTGTGSKNIEFNATFDAENAESFSAISDVNNQDLAIYLKLNVKKDGYLKNGKVEVKSAEEGKELNYCLQEQNLEELTTVESIENNEINLKQIECDSEVLISLPIKYENEEFVNLEKLTGSSKILFTGTYVNEKGNETEVSKEIDLSLSWKDEKEVKVSSDVTKYIPYSSENGDGIILQTEVSVDTTSTENSLPVKSTEINVAVPTVNGIEPSNITLIAASTVATNGKSDETVVFTEENWKYDEYSKTLTIMMQNDEQTVQIAKVSEDSESFVDGIFTNADQEYYEENRYYSLTGLDKYIITYSYENLTMVPNMQASTNVSAKVITYSGVQEEENESVVDVNQEYTYDLENQKGDIVSLEVNNETTEISKAYTYLNYNNEENYTINFNSKVIVNVSYKDIVNEIKIEDTNSYYIDKAGNSHATEDVIYKSLIISKENIVNILGEAGYLKISDKLGNEIFTVTNEIETDEAGNVIIDIENKNINQIVITTSKPVSDGNIIVNTEKIMKKSSYSKEEYKEFSSINFETKLSANYNFVSNEIEVEKNITTTNLKDTTSDAKVVLDRDSLSTIANNENVEIRVELNNHLETSDVYGNSTFEIEMPAYIDKMEILDTSIVYGEGLELKEVNAYEDNGIIKIAVSIEGMQKYLNSGVLTNGCNIVINANIKVNLFAPAMEQEIKLKYQNSEATNYANGLGESKATVSYSAPSGVLTVNSTTGFDDLGSMITSVRQGTKEATIEIFAPERTATMEIVVMNNNKNTISNLSILGRIPFKGVKDILSGEELGTTVDTSLVSGIVADSQNRGEFVIYYSSNPEATKNLNDSLNGWTTNMESLEEVKSYLIVPTDENYIMDQAEILRFTYEYKIPANLEHNTDIYGTFLAYYTNNTSIATIEESSTADKVGLTTGEGPQVNLSLEPSIEIVKEFEEYKYKMTVTNTGKSKIENVNVKLAIPQYTSYAYSTSSIEGMQATLVDGVAVFNIDEIEVNRSVDLEVILKVLDLPEEISEITTYATITAKDLQKELRTEDITVQVKQAELHVTFKTMEDNADGMKVIYKEGDEYYFDMTVRNLLEKTQENVILTMNLPSEFEMKKAYMVGYEDDGITRKEVDVATFDEEKHQIIWNLGKIEGNSLKQCRTYVTVSKLENGITQKDINLYAEVKGDNTEVYKSNEVIATVARPNLVISQTTNTTNTYVKEGEYIEYVFSIKNEGIVTADKVSFRDEIPEGLIAKSIEYVINGMPVKKTVTEKDAVEINTSINPGSELVATVKALATSLGGVQEKTVTNSAKISAKNIEQTETNTITHIIEATDKSNMYDTEGESASASSQINSNGNIVKTYKITGIAWVDENNDGKRDDGEQRLNGITARLVNSDTGVIVKTVTTNSKGEYSFNGIANGNYLVVFEYDTIRYTVTTYQKSGIESNINSDAITTKIEQDGKTKNGAVTDIITIQDLSISNIDIGLVLADKFDLQLDKVVKKVTAQSKSATNKADYEGTKLAKIDIAGKYIASTTVYIEYAITVSNIGDVAGYAQKVVDYIPNGMTFNSSMNSDWYTGLDGNLYSSSLATTELQPGESKTLTLVLTKQMTAENTGIVNNKAEIYEDYNIYGISDTNSTPNNQIQSENDMSSADTILTIKTGETLIYTSVIITSIILGSIVVFIVYNKVIISRRKRGV